MSEPVPEAKPAVCSRPRRNAETLARMAERATAQWRDPAYAEAQLRSRRPEVAALSLAQRELYRHLTRNRGLRPADAVTMARRELPS